MVHPQIQAQGREGRNYDHELFHDFTISQVVKLIHQPQPKHEAPVELQYPGQVDLKKRYPHPSLLIYLFYFSPGYSPDS
jgi:hypothetical protein